MFTQEIKNIIYITLSFITFSFYALEHSKSLPLYSEKAAAQKVTGRIEKEKESKLIIMIFVVGIIILSSFLLFKIIKPFEFFWAFFSAIFSISLLGGIIFVWYTEVTSGTIKKQEYIIQNKQDLDNFLAFLKKKNPKLFLNDAHFIPIGFVINALDIELKGIHVYEWQWINYDLTKDNELKGNFVVMFKKEDDHRVSSVLTVKEKNLRNEQSDYKFEIPANFNLKKYPFDHQQITILMQHPSYVGNIILVPAFDNYDSSRTPYPPISPSIQFNKWYVKNAYFFYTLTDYFSNFGVTGWAQEKDFPILSYTIEVQRSIADPLISTLAPLFIILFIVFCMLLIQPKIDIRKSANSILGLFASVFFATVVSHQTFDQTIITGELVYFKCFYYLTYFIILITAINFLLLIYFKNISILEYRKNLIMRLLYWPLTTLILFIITIIYFY
ncbi:MAG: hypothetical protein K2X90_01450 [Candidatus Babeliaceae bacterium]|nr:hypothetical protein [Candidatus Babeliaceae bacterium]